MAPDPPCKADRAGDVQTLDLNEVTFGEPGGLTRHHQRNAHAGPHARVCLHEPAEVLGRIDLA